MRFVFRWRPFLDEKGLIFDRMWAFEFEPSSKMGTFGDRSEDFSG